MRSSPLIAKLLQIIIELIMADNGSNDQKRVEITLAVLNAKLEGLDTKLDSVIKRLGQINHDQETRIRGLERSSIKLCVRWDNHSDEHEAHDKEHDSLKSKIIGFDAAAVFAIIGSYFMGK